ncbi:hypothetical protein [Psychrosphaera aestuarii]|uniref:hypothetical protein n=1 Tax=Psychrosphaera aestuarii TaxID=1266052 RepID=UPI001B33A9FA|nr:hypothetical protein [Psychrosphaera aestuarii]
MFKRQGLGFRRNKNYMVKKGGLREALVDQQVLIIHQAIAKKLVACHQQGDHQYEIKMLETMNKRRDEGRMKYGEYLTWQSLLEIIGNSDDFIKGMLEDSPQMRKYRRRTPCVGILTEEERTLALEIGTSEQIDNARF